MRQLYLRLPSDTVYVECEETWTVGDLFRVAAEHCGAGIGDEDVTLFSETHEEEGLNGEEDELFEDREAFLCDLPLAPEATLHVAMSNRAMARNRLASLRVPLTESAVMNAIIRDIPETLRLLYAADVNINSIHVELAVRLGSEKSLVYLLGEGSIDLSQAPAGVTPLISLIRGDLPSSKKILYLKMMSINETKDEGYLRDALSWAVSCGEMQIAEYLVANGLHVHGVDVNSKTALHLLAENGEPSEGVTRLVGTLAERGLQTTPDVEGLYPLHCLVKFYRPEVVAALLQFYPETDCRTELDETPAMIATQVESLGCLKVLVQHGADLRLCDASGWCILFYASQCRSASTLSYLLGDNVGSDRVRSINSSDNSGWTPLFLAAQSGSREVVMFLLANGADPSVRCSRGDRACDIARQCEHLEVAALLE